MTVIAYSTKHRILAADSRASDDKGEYHLTDCQKVYRLKNGALLGLAGDGDSRDLQTLLEKATPRKMPSRAQLVELKLDATALLVFPKGQVFMITAEYMKSRESWTGEVMPIRDRYVAIGSGQAYAYGAMEAGADPIKAVRAACRRDLLCALPVDWEEAAMRILADLVLIVALRFVALPLIRFDTWLEDGKRRTS